MITVHQGAGNTQVFFKLSQINNLTEFGIRNAWFKVGKDLKKTANKDVLAKPRKGRTYMIRGPSGRRRRHVASLPGESHANMTGVLRKSIQWKVGGRDLKFGYGIANANAPDYAKFVEKTRPTLKNSINKNQRNSEQHLLFSVMSEFK